MALTTTNYFDRVKKVDFSKLPPALQKSHDLVKKVGTGSEPWANYHASEPIRNMINLYFEKMDAWLEANGMGEKIAPAPKPAAPKKPVKTAPTVPTKKPASTPKAPKPVKVTASKAKHPELEYFTSKGKLVKGHLDPEKLYYLQPDGSYEQGGDRRSPGWVTPPKAKAPKAPKAKKEKPAKPAPRHVVSKLPEDVLLMRAFVGLTEKQVTQQQVRNLHGRFQRAIAGRRVRHSSEHADHLTEMAGLVARLYAKMTDKDEPIASIGALTLPADLLARVRADIKETQVSAAIPLLSRFIGMQGTVPGEKAVAALAKALGTYHAEHPSGDYSVAVGAAAAVLGAWQPGKVVKVTAAQLNGLRGLAGLGCPDLPSAPCGCGKKTGR